MPLVILACFHTSQNDRRAFARLLSHSGYRTSDAESYDRNGFSGQLRQGVRKILRGRFAIAQKLVNFDQASTVPFSNQTIDFEAVKKDFYSWPQSPIGIVKPEERQ